MLSAMMVVNGWRRFARLDIATRAAVLSFGSNAALMVLKVVAGLVFGSIAVLSDGVDSGQDVIASAIALFSVRLALQPADEAHPYGHGKAESLAAMSQAALIAGGATFIAVAALRRLVADDVEIVVGPSLATAGVAAIVNLGVAAYSMHAARISESMAIRSDARHLLTNVVQAIAVGLGLVLVGVTGRHVFDPLVALALAAYLAFVAVRILREAVMELVDTSLPDAEVELIERCLSREGQGMRGYHELRTRKSGREKHIDVHILVDPALSVSDAHRLLEDLEEEVGRLLAGAVVTVHVDPDEPGIMERAHEAHAAGAVETAFLHKH